MVVQLEDAVIKTQKTFKPMFSKPKCSSKLLSKPPFRFIHDIITATMMATGFPKNYFTAQELSSKNLKDKSTKIAFLNKLIYLVSVCHGAEIDVRPSKIVAGLEPINTNILLTLFGEIATNLDNTFDHAAAIKHCQFGGSIGEFVGKGMVQDHHHALKRINISEKEIVEEGKEEGNEIVKVSEDTKNSETCDNDNEASLGSDTKRSSPYKNDVPVEDLLSTSEFTGEKQAADEKENHAEVYTSLHDIIATCNSDPITTKHMMGKIITKPKCTEKLLKKPPFRFLHDIIMAVNETTAIGLENILSANELDSSAVTTKETKIKFLDKIINFLANRLSINIDLKPSKVVAGLEPEKTCHFLQIFGTYAINYKIGATWDASTKAKSKTIPSLNPHQEDVRSCHGDIEIQKVSPESKSVNNDIVQLQPQGMVTSSTSEEKSLNQVGESIHGQEEDSKENNFTEEGKVDSLNKSSHSKGCHDSNLVEESEPKFDLSTEEVKGHDVSYGRECKISTNLSPSMQISETRSSCNYIEKESTKSSIQIAFFGEEEQQSNDAGVILDEVYQTSRPKTARRRPPRIKEIERPKDLKSGSFHETNKAIFKEEIHKFDNYPSSSADEEKDPKEIKCTISYNFAEMCDSLQTIANSVFSIGKAMDFIPSEMNTIRKEMLYHNDEKAMYLKELEKVQDMTQIELRPIQLQVDAIKNEIEDTLALVESRKRLFGENEEWIRRQMKRICKV